MSFVRFDSGSAADGELADGCKYCIEGAKMVLLVTGRCSMGCFYCPVSAEKKGKDVIYANEGRVFSDEEVIEEAESMDALGAGITGGDPSQCLDRTLHYITLLKGRFGKGFHLHMYTSTISTDNAKKLEEAGLDEIRYHPGREMWADMGSTELAHITAATKMDVGIEVPALPGCEDDLIRMCEYAFSVGVRFVNLNELEFSESNWDMMEAHGYEVRDDVSAAVLGSEETALKVMESCKGSIHFCSSPFKDGVQLRRRLIRKAENVCKDYQGITEDGTIVRGYLYAQNPEEAAAELREMGVEDDMMAVLDGKVEVAPWILEEIAEELEYKCCISEQYPTADGLEVERTPLN